MNASNKRTHTYSPAKYAMAAAIAVAVGLGTVYWLFAPSDNGSGAGSGSVSAPSSGDAPAASGESAAAGPLKGLNKGAMAAFVVRTEPLDLPDFAFQGPEGDAFSAADLKGKVVLLNIWATWCVPCREEMPQLNELQAELGDDSFEVVALNIEKGGEAKARKFLEETAAHDLALHTDPTGKVFATLKAVGMPTTLLLNRQGKEMGRLVGPADWASPEAKALIEAAIAAP